MSSSSLRCAHPRRRVKNGMEKQREKQRSREEPMMGDKNNGKQLGSSAILFVPNPGVVFSTVRICPKSSSKKVTSFVISVPTNNRRISSEYIIPYRVCRLFWTSTDIND